MSIEACWNALWLENWCLSTITGLGNGERRREGNSWGTMGRENGKLMTWEQGEGIGEQTATEGNIQSS